MENHMLDLRYIRVCEDDGDDLIELPVESDDTVLLSTLTAQFPKATGLKYKATGSNCLRGVRLADGHLYPPAEGWEAFNFSCVFPKDNKRKSDDDERHSAKSKRLEGKKCTDLIVLSLAWRTDEDALKSYFSRYGEVVMAQIKRDPNTKQSRGYGFIRFRDYDSQVMCLAERHVIDNRWCDVRIPMSKYEGDRQEVSRKVHVGRITESMTSDVLRDHFSAYGRVLDVFVPKPFRSFAFVTFEDANVASDLLGKEEEIDGSQVTIGSAVPKLPSAGMNAFGGVGAMGVGNAMAGAMNSMGMGMGFGPVGAGVGGMGAFGGGGGNPGGGGGGMSAFGMNAFGGGGGGGSGGGAGGSGGGTNGNAATGGPMSAARAAHAQQQQIMAAGQAAAAFQLAMQAAMSGAGASGFGGGGMGGGGRGGGMNTMGNADVGFGRSGHNQSTGWQDGAMRNGASGRR